MSTNEMPDEDAAKIAAAIVAKMKATRSYLSGARPPDYTTKELLALSMQALVEHQRGTLALMQAVNALAKQTVKEKKDGVNISKPAT